MCSNSVQVVGISVEAVSLLRQRFTIWRASWNGEELLPFIGFVLASHVYKEDGQVIERGEHFVMGAISKAKIEEEIIFSVDGLDIAIRIPNIVRLFGEYYFDVRDGEIVNTCDKKPDFIID